MAYFPLFVNLKDKNVLVIGGSEAAFAEVSRFLAFNANIILLADDFCDDLVTIIAAYAKHFHIVEKTPSLEAVKSIEKVPTLVISTVQDSELNSEIYEYFQGRNILVQDSSNASRCDFIFPAIIKRGDVVCGISSSGKSPHVSQFLKQLIECSIPENINDINEHMSALRHIVSSAVSEPEKRRKAMQTIFMRLIEDDNMTSDADIEAILSEIG